MGSYRSSTKPSGSKPPIDIFGGLPGARSVSWWARSCPISIDLERGGMSKPDMLFNTWVGGEGHNPCHELT